MFGNLFFTQTRGENCPFVYKIFEIGSGKTWRALGNMAQTDTRFKRLSFCMNLENRLTLFDIGKIQNNSPIKPTRAKKRGIENVGAIGRRYDNNLISRLKAVHLNKNLVERLLTLIVPAAKTSTAMAPDRINLIDKNNRGSGFLCRAKQIPHARSADADKHLDKFRRRNMEKRHARLPRNCAGKKSLSGARRAHKENTARNPRANLKKFLRVLEKFNNLFKLFFCFVHPRNIFKGDAFFYIVGRDNARARLTKPERLHVCTIYLPPHKPHKSDDKKERNKRRECSSKPKEKPGWILFIMSKRCELFLRNAEVFERFGERGLLFFF